MAAAALDTEQAAARAAEGALLAYPTETVWGLGADARLPEAVAALRRFKGREAGKALSVLVSGREALARLGARVPPHAEKLMAAFWPGPLTLVLRCEARLAPGVAGPGGALGLRCSTHPVAAALARALEARGAGPLTATSLNRSGEPPARGRGEAEAVCAAGPAERARPPRVDEAPRPAPAGRAAAPHADGGADAGAAPAAPLLVAGPDAGGGAPSTVVDATGPQPAVLREGALTEADLLRLLGESS